MGIKADISECMQGVDRWKIEKWDGVKGGIDKDHALGLAWLISCIW